MIWKSFVNQWIESLWVNKSKQEDLVLVIPLPLSPQLRLQCHTFWRWIESSDVVPKRLFLILMTRIVVHIKRAHGSNRITPSLPPAVTQHKLNLSSTAGWRRVLAGGGGFVSASCGEESGRISLPARLKINRSGWPQVAGHYKPRSLRCLHLQELSHDWSLNSNVDRWRSECPERISVLAGLASLNTESEWAQTQRQASISAA